MEHKRIEKDAYEMKSKKYDFHIRLEGDEWITDVFNAKIKNHSEAYIDSFATDDLNEAIFECENYV